MTQTPDFATKPTLTGERVILRPYIDADLPALREAMADPDLLRLTGSIHDEAEALQPVSPEEEQLRLDWFNTRNDQDNRLDLAIVDKASGGCVGEAVLNQWDPGNQSCNFRIQIGPARQNRGLGTEATRLIVGYGFEQLGLHRISLEVYAFNPRARHVYEKAGFVAEGVLREALRYGDGWIDATVMSILDHEWARHRGRPAIPSSRQPRV